MFKVKQEEGDEGVEEHVPCRHFLATNPLIFAFSTIMFNTTYYVSTPISRLNNSAKREF